MAIALSVPRAEHEPDILSPRWHRRINAFPTKHNAFPTKHDVIVTAAPHALVACGILQN